jgi:hypothetical protein
MYQHDKLYRGDHMVSFKEENLDIVAFVCVEEQQRPGVLVRVPRATAFLTVIKSDPSWTGYVVTAAHVLEGIGNQTFYLRFNTQAGFDDVEMSRGEWFIHDRADVALARVQWSTYTLRSIYPEQFIGADYGLRVGEMLATSLVQLPGQFSGSTIQIETGNDVSIIGLFAQHYGQSKSLPVARSGTIARMPSEPVEYRHPGGTYSQAPAYLVEFRSWGGHSGSPVLVHRRIIHLIQTQVNSLSGSAREFRSETVWLQDPDAEVFGFLGLVSGHFDIEQQAQTSGDIFGSITTAINSGIAIITPAEAVRELLWRDDVVEDRQQVLDATIQARAQGIEHLTPPPRRILSSESTEQ